MNLGLLASKLNEERIVRIRSLNRCLADTNEAFLLQAKRVSETYSEDYKMLEKATNMKLLLITMKTEIEQQVLRIDKYSHELDLIVAKHNLVEELMFPAKKEE